jgi:CRISPR-associated RAMP protein (TIGR02581 family)
MKEKYFFKGKIELESGLHIGGGKFSTTHTDSPVMKTPAGFPFIPGSSFKGVFRATAEKIAGNIGLKSCLLEKNVEKPNCLSSMKKDDKQMQKYDHLRKEKRYDEIEKLLSEELCHTCKLFGSSFKSSKIYFSDLYLDLDTYSGTTEVRDGVVIDRDSETAFDKLKYDYEVVPSGNTFSFEIILEDPVSKELGLFLAVLAEFKNHFAFLGGNKSRGLGKCRVTNLEISKVDYSDPKKLADYLLNGSKSTEKMSDPEIEEFFNLHINELVSAGG